VAISDRDANRVDQQGQGARRCQRDDQEPEDQPAGDRLRQEGGNDASHGFSRSPPGRRRPCLPATPRERKSPPAPRREPVPETVSPGPFATRLPWPSRRSRRAPKGSTSASPAPLEFVDQCLPLRTRPGDRERDRGTGRRESQTTANCPSGSTRPIRTVFHVCWFSGSIDTTPSGAFIDCCRRTRRTAWTSAVPASATARAQSDTPQ